MLINTHIYRQKKDKKNYYTLWNNYKKELHKLMYVLKIRRFVTRAFGPSPCPCWSCCLLGNHLSFPNSHLLTPSMSLSGAPASAVANGNAEPSVCASLP